CLYLFAPLRDRGKAPSTIARGRKRRVTLVPCLHERMRAREASVSVQKLSALLSAAVTAVLTIAILLLAMGAGRADHAPHYTADGAVVDGDWGLYRAGHMVPWGYGPQVIGAARYGAGHYL